MANSFSAQIRKGLEKLGLKKLITNYNQSRFRKKYEQTISPEDLEERFSNIYADGIWSKNGESLSGTGSTMGNTVSLRASLPAVLKNLEVGTMLDLGCGDFHWMKQVDLPCKYIGADIVEHVIKANQEKYSNDERSFMHLNGVTDALPDCDAIFIREVLFHLSFEDSLSLLNNCKESSAQYLIATTNPTIEVNTDIRSGQFRKINLERPPYSLPKAIGTLMDDDNQEGRIMGVWKLR